MLIVAGTSASGEGYTRTRRGLYVASRQQASISPATERAQVNRELVRSPKPAMVWVPSLEVGFLAGPIFSFAKTSPSASGNTLNAFSFSLTLDKKLSETFYLCPELGYVQRGVHTQLYSFSGFQIAGDVSLTYLEIPILLKAKFPVNRRLKTFLTAGPNFGLALSREVEVMGLVEMDLTNRFGQYDFGVLLGGGAEYMMSRDLSFIAGLRYTLGLVDIDTGDESYMTRSIQILFGLRMGL